MSTSCKTHKHTHLVLGSTYLSSFLSFYYNFFTACTSAVLIIMFSLSSWYLYLLITLPVPFSPLHQPHFHTYTHPSHHFHGQFLPELCDSVILSLILISLPWPVQNMYSTCMLSFIFSIHCTISSQLVDLSGSPL